MKRNFRYIYGAEKQIYVSITQNMLLAQRFHDSRSKVLTLISALRTLVK